MRADFSLREDERQVAESRRHHGRPDADPLGPWHRIRGDEPHRRADDRRYGVVHHPHAGRDPGGLRADQGARADVHRAETKQWRHFAISEVLTASPWTARMAGNRRQAKRTIMC